MANHGQEEISGRGVKGGPNLIDSHVGRRVRLRRTLLGMSQEQLAREVGLTFQQIQKYERGTNRISASRLFQLASVLDVSILFFFDDMSTDARNGLPSLTEHSAVTFDQKNFTSRETLELVRAYYKIKDPVVRRRSFDLIKALSRFVGNETE